ncbi:MAG: PSD1 and planctomycete cytochrome C domain-containing protein [Fuerstiella sp.]
MIALIQPCRAIHADEIDFRRDVQPILADKCFHCHGPDAQNQNSEFRADSKDGLFADLGGYFAVVPADLGQSELHARVHSQDPDLQMPPPDSNRSLSDQQKRTLDNWIQQGAPYQGHWAFDRVERPAVPTQEAANPIDAFIMRRLQQEELQLSEKADPATRLRRASLTLTGLLPPKELQDQFLSDPTDQAFESAVDELLNSMAYAERQSLKWLDAARYADTDGFQNDSERTNWPWRDWVTQAYNDNMPFDQFTIEQIAGDMIPNATDSQKLASAFNRNHRQNAEGGALAAEFLVENVIDRVETTSTVFLGLTMGCARCHDHKYDPLSQREFFQMYAYFNNIGERGIGPGIKANPTMMASSVLVKVPEQLRQDVTSAQHNVAKAKRGFIARLETWIQKTKQHDQKQVNAWKLAQAESASVEGQGELIQQDQFLKFNGPTQGRVTYKVTLPASQHSITGLQFTALPDENYGKPKALAASVNGNFVMSNIAVLAGKKTVNIASVSATVQQDKYPVRNLIDKDQESGWAVLGDNSQPVPASAIIAFEKPVSQGQSLTIKLTFPNRFANHNAGKIQFHTSNLPVAQLVFSGQEDAILVLVNKPASKRTKAENQKLKDHFSTIDELTVEANRDLTQANKALNQARGPLAPVMIMQEKSGPPTEAYLLDRGQYDAPVKDAPLPRAVPTALMRPLTSQTVSSTSATEESTPAIGKTAQPKDRLELAQWLVSRNNPLTARVTVNRIWQDHFGVGLVKTTEDFGVQGEVPSHPDLLDWLAVELMESGWNVKALHRLIVTSRTYQQSSKTNAKLIEIDPENRLLAKGPRYRADGFTIRDIALQASGLLKTKPGGPSVKPYQPAGLWANLAARKGTKYSPSKGDDLYRKSMYTYWKRAVNPPRQTIFDASGREVCNVRVRRTNTPLQALVLMNDPAMIEAARMLAQSSMTSPQGSTAQRIATMYRQAVARAIDPSSQAILLNSHRYYTSHFEAHPDEASQLLQIGDASLNKNIAQSELAAMTSVAHLILNLDEFMTVE